MVSPIQRNTPLALCAGSSQGGAAGEGPRGGCEDGEDLGISEGHPPDKVWLLHFLSTYSPRDEIFDKSYLPPAPHSQVKLLKTIDIPLGFLKNLPPSKKLPRKNRLGIVREGKEALKRARLENRQSKISTALSGS